MIWQDESSTTAGSVSLHQHIISELRLLCRAQLDVSMMREIARAVERYLDLLPIASAVSDDYLALIIARALSGAGEQGAANEVLSRLALSGVDSRVVDQLAGCHDLTPARWRLFAARLVRPSRWSSEGGRMVWVLDLRRLQLGEDHCFELSLLPVLRRVLLTFCGVWDSEKGRGVLALAGLEDVSRRLSRTSKGARHVAAQVERYCRESLAHGARDRGWASHPRVVVLDAAKTTG